MSDIVDIGITTTDTSFIKTNVYNSIDGNPFRGNRVDVVLDTDNNVYVNGVLKLQSLKRLTTIPAQNIGLMCGFSNYRLRGKFYFARIYDKGVLIRDYVPCYKKDDETIGMYDLVTQQFYENAGTGTFIKGPNI